MLKCTDIGVGPALVLFVDPGLESTDHDELTDPGFVRDWRVGGELNDITQGQSSAAKRFDPDHQPLGGGFLSESQAWIASQVPSQHLAATVEREYIRHPLGIWRWPIFREHPERICLQLFNLIVAE